MLRSSARKRYADENSKEEEERPDDSSPYIYILYIYYTDLIQIINILQQDNMTISLEQLKFFKLEKAFLGHSI